MEYMKPVKVFFQYVFVSFLGAWRCITFYIISIKPHLFSQSQFMNKKQWIVQCHGPHFINCSPKLMFAGFNNQSPPHYLCLFSNLLTVKSTQNDKFAGLMQTISSLNFFSCLHKAVKILNEQRWHWLHRFFCLRKPDSYTVTIYELCVSG